MTSTLNPGKTMLTVCTCGKLHFTYGPITVRFEPDQFLAFAAGVAALSAQFRQSMGLRHPAEASTAEGHPCH